MRTYLELGPVHAHVDSVIEGPPLEILFVIRVVDYVVQLLVNLGQPTKRDPWHIIRTTDGRKSVGLSQPGSISILSLATSRPSSPLKYICVRITFRHGRLYTHSRATTPFMLHIALAYWTRIWKHRAMARKKWNFARKEKENFFWSDQ